MQNKVTVSAVYSISASSIATLPEGRTWEDVEEAHASLTWDTLHIVWKDQTTDTIELDSPLDFCMDSMAIKRPSYLDIYATQEDGSECFDRELFSS